MKKLEENISHDLRQQAEERFKNQTRLPKNLSAAETAQIIHELQVHQIELEMQNEELREAQVRLEESRNRYTNLYNFAPVGYLTLSTIGEILEANLTAADLLGIERSHLLGVIFPSLLMESDRGSMLHLLTNCGSRPKSREEYRIQRRGGDLHTLLLDLLFIQGTFGNDRWHVSFTDITELKQTQEELRHYKDHLEEMVATRTASLEQTLEELREAKENQEALFQAAPITIAVFDAEGRLVDLNPAGERTFGWSRAEAHGHLVPSIPPKAPEASLELMERVLRGEAFVGVELQQQRRDGSLLDARLSLAPLHDRQGGVRGFVVLAEDITAVKQTEKSLKESEERFRAMFELASVGMAQADLDTGRWQRVNRKLCEITGYSADELLSMSFTEITHPEDRQRDCDAFQRVVQGEAPAYRNEKRYIRKDGKIVWVNVNVTLMYGGGNGQPWFSLAVIEDITASKRTEEAIIRAKQEWERTFDSVPDLIFLLDHEHTIVRINRAMAASVNMEPQDLVGRKCYELMHHSSSPPPFCPHAQLLADGAEHAVEVQALGRNFLVSASPLIDPRRKVIGSVHVARDLTAQKRLELELRSSQERLNLALAAARMGVWEWDVQTDATFWSPECGAFLGLDGSEGTLESFTSCVHPEDLDMVMAEVNRVLAEKIDYADEFRIIRPDGEVRGAANVGRVHYDEHGRPQRLIGAIQDITERKNAESEKTRLQEQLLQSQKMEAIGTLAGGIAHDFNNILWAILGYAEMAAYDIDNSANVREYLEQVLQAGHRAKELVGQILAFSRRLATDKKPLLLRLIVMEAGKLLRASLPTTIEIRQNICSHKAILADATQIHQVIMNLATNAFHAMEETGGVLVISLEDMKLHRPPPVVQGDLQPGDYVRLQVQDTGPGITAEIQSRIFEPYFSTKEVGKGTGMGLAMVLGIVKSHGGEIVLESQPGQGTIFSLYFPALTETPTAFQPVTEAELPRGTGRILFVDDEPELAKLGKIILSKLGYTVSAITNSLEALEIFRTLPKSYDLVITDLTMPRLTGVDLVRHLQKIRPDIPIVICTGYRERLSREDIEKLGINEIMIKPVEARQLAEVVQRILRSAPVE
jgi:PAS domain S-box-containing protein